MCGQAREREAGGMIISRRPNRRASTENAPGPNRTTAALMAMAKTADSFASKRLGAVTGNRENVTATVPRLINAATNGVRSPTVSNPPLTIASKHVAHVPSEGSARPARLSPPCTTIVTPTAARSNSRPAPGQPPGNAENNRCSPRLLQSYGASAIHLMLG